MKLELLFKDNKRFKSLPKIESRNGIDGKDGKAGQDGFDGKSAYDLWLSLGNKGTIYDFFDSLVGSSGKQGEPGKQGKNGSDGQNGRDGQNGKSAYEIWLELGNKGDEQAFISSLHGRTIIGQGLAIGGNRNDILTRNDPALAGSTKWSNISTLSKSYKIINEDYTAEIYDYYIETQTANITITLPNYPLMTGKEIHIDNAVEGEIIIIGQDGQTINGDTELILIKDKAIIP